jgi:4-hydroxy-4-methyl-2-oxoglutarate aldolase
MSVTDDEAVAAARRLMEIDTGHVSDALERTGIRTPVLTDRFRPLTSAARFAGRAVTLELARSRTGSESRRLSELLDDAVHPASVVVIDAHGDTSATPFGDRAGLVAQRNGATGAVLHGGVRDVDGLNELRFPVHATARALPASEGKLQAVALNGPVVLDGVLIEPGDWLAGDSSGICVIPAASFERVLELAEERQAIDDESFEALRAGRTLSEAHRHFRDDDVEAIRVLE